MRLALLVGLAAVPAAADSQEVSAVTVDVVVIDRDGNPVPGLMVDDFAVRVRDVILPVTQVRVLAKDSAPRRFIVVVNRRGAEPSQLRRLQAGLEEFVIGHFGTLDEAMFVDFAEVPRITREWRTGPTAAREEVRAITPIGFRSPSGHGQDSADAAFMLAALAERLEQVPGRKIVLLFSGALRVSSGEPGGDIFSGAYAVGGRSHMAPRSGPGAEDAPGALAYAFTAASASVYAFHLGGSLRTQPTDILEASRQEFGQLTAGSGEGAALSGARPGNRSTSASVGGRLRTGLPGAADDFLSSLATETGGTYTARATDFGRVLQPVEAANRLWYEVTFDADVPTVPGAFEHVRIELADPRGRTVIAHSGYVTPR